MNDEMATAFVEESKNRVAVSRDFINHCIDQLQDDDMWSIPAEGSNSIGVIIQHLLGNLRQWIISGVGGAPDVRDRPREFRMEEKTPKSTLQKRLNDRLDQVIDTYSRLDPSILLDQSRIQGFEQSALSAIYGTMTHLALHAGQIAYITRLRLGRAYRESWTPATREQGA